MGEAAEVDVVDIAVDREVDMTWGLAGTCAVACSVVVGVGRSWVSSELGGGARDSKQAVSLVAGDTRRMLRRIWRVSLRSAGRD